MMPNLPPVKPPMREAPAPERMPPPMGGGGCPLFAEGQCTFLNTPVQDLVTMKQQSEEGGETPPQETAEHVGGATEENERPL